jgi:hypothetical protein
MLLAILRAWSPRSSRWWGSGMAILVAITEIDHLIAPTNNPYGMNR